MPQNWKTVRVFISSTFRDMQAERDWLVRFVFPRLRDELQKQRIHLVDVDLRWGVTTEQDALDVCLEVIDECRPRFLCILGGRYGCVPPGKTRSITADEIHYGVLDHDLSKRGFPTFYFRDETAIAAMVEATPGEFREPQGSDKQTKLGELKKAIVEAGLHPFTYPAQWDKENARLTGLKVFGDRVFDDLLNGMKSDPELRERFMMDTTAQLDEFSEEKAAMDAFVAERNEGFVLGSRATVLNELLAHTITTGGNGYVCLIGQPGSGKSALLAHLSQHSTLNNQPTTILIRHFVGTSPGSTDVRRTMRRFCHELKVGCPDITARIPDDPEELRAAFLEFLRQASANHRVVILIDAINQFDSASYATRFQWLPDQPPNNARFILSALEGPALEYMRRRPGKPVEIELKPLTTDDGEAIIEQFRQRYHKKLEPEQRAALLTKADAGTPLYLLAALEELRTLGTYEEITRRIVEIPPKTNELFAWILERLENDDGFRDTKGLRVGRDLVSRFAMLLGASRYGLSQGELSELLEVGDPQGNIAALLHLLRPYLMHRGALLDFYHGQFREAVWNLYPCSPQNPHEARKWLAQYFQLIRPERPGLQPTFFHLPWQFTDPEDWETYDELLLGTAPKFQRTPAQNTHASVPDGLRPSEKLMLGYLEPPRNEPTVSRRIQEYPWQLAKNGQWQELFTFLSDPILFHVLWQRDQFDAMGYWAQLRQFTGLRMDQAYSQVLDHPESWSPEIISILAILFRQQDYADQAFALHQELTRRAKQGHDLSNLAGSLMNQGVVMDHKGEIEKAIDLYLEAEKIFRQLGDNPGLAQCLGNRGVSLSRQERYADAMALFDEAEHLSRQVGDRLELQRTLGEKALILKQRGEFERSINLLREKETICRELDHRQGLAVSLGNQALVLKDQDHPERGLPLLDEVESIYRELGNEEGLRLTRQNRGHLLFKNHDIEGAMAVTKSIAAQDNPSSILEEEQELVRDMRAEDADRPTAAIWELVSGGEFTQALRMLDTCEGELKKNPPNELWRLARCRAYLLLKQKMPQAALELCEHALDMMRESGWATSATWTTKDFRFHIKSRL